jgi:hypothetical protein
LGNAVWGHGPYSEKHTKQLNIVCGKVQRFLMLKQEVLIVITLNAFNVFPQLFQANSGIVNQNRSLPLHSTNLSIHYLQASSCNTLSYYEVDKILSNKLRL